MKPKYTTTYVSEPETGEDYETKREMHESLEEEDDRREEPVKRIALLGAKILVGRGENKPQSEDDAKVNALNGDEDEPPLASSNIITPTKPIRKSARVAAVSKNLNMTATRNLVVYGPFDESKVKTLNAFVKEKHVFHTNRNGWVPQARPPYGDCGIYAVKYLECLVMGVAFSEEHLCDSNMEMKRWKLAAEMTRMSCQYKQALPGHASPTFSDRSLSVLCSREAEMKCVHCGNNKMWILRLTDFSSTFSKTNPLRNIAWQALPKYPLTPIQCNKRSASQNKSKKSKTVAREGQENIAVRIVQLEDIMLFKTPQNDRSSCTKFPSKLAKSSKIEDTTGKTTVQGNDGDQDPGKGGHKGEELPFEVEDIDVVKNPPTPVWEEHSDNPEEEKSKKELDDEKAITVSSESHPFARMEKTEKENDEATSSASVTTVQPCKDFEDLIDRTRTLLQNLKSPYVPGTQVKGAVKRYGMNDMLSEPHWVVYGPVAASDVANLHDFIGRELNDESKYILQSIAAAEEVVDRQGKWSYI
ncbi:hypothetical protein Bca52824_016173 [Brassica carinata]|uniref:Ubiquitin-like protease family profile domain-containing protein n=1 Tax=Brassica carinata TaxID=52824 RepID=A0A8X8B560_BRACI|nr:hypothetical protein Bca52824_016173 [Brassica carinata]